MFLKTYTPKKALYIIVCSFAIGIFFTSCGFALKKHLVGKYYLIGVDTETDVSLSYQSSSGDYIGKAPPRIIEYGYNDTFLIAKTQEYSKTYPTYYIIDMTKDSELAHEESFRVGPLTEIDFNTTGVAKLKIHMTKLD